PRSGLTVDCNDAQTRRTPVDVSAFAHDGLCAPFPTDRQVGVRCAVRQNLVAGDAVLDDRKKIERKSCRQRTRRCGGCEMRANDRKEILRLRDSRAKDVRHDRRAAAMTRSWASLCATRSGWADLITVDCGMP